ncbi:MAG: hypothetical protein GWQ05_09560 [Verrucomicrobiaceae bacterium]|nr:hypothetical protein [Verrucomicrobiaceae bacterium]NCF91189.1 hypothetical protein [Verrucomicrobiaceae bacterium]
MKPEYYLADGTAAETTFGEFIVSTYNTCSGSDAELIVCLALDAGLVGFRSPGWGETSPLAGEPVRCSGRVPAVVLSGVHIRRSDSAPSTKV